MEDLLYYFPRDYEDRSKPKAIAELASDQEALIEAIPVSSMSNIHVNGKTIQKLIVRDETATCTLTWFNQPYLKDKFKLHQKYKFFGKVQNKFGKIDMLNPVYDREETTKNTGKIIPIYPLTYSLSGNSIRQIIENGLKDMGDNLEETLPEYILKQYNLEDINTAIHEIHFPKDFESFDNAKKRLVFEELLTMQIALLALKNKYNTAEKGIQFDKDVKVSDIIDTLPFKLTKAQSKVIEEIELDMEKDKPMNRLLQGDVGSRKNYCKYYCGI